MGTMPERMGKNATLTGYREMERVLQQLPEKVQNKVVRQSIRAGARPLIRSMRSGASQVSSRISQAIGIVVRRYRSGDLHVGVVGVRRGAKYKNISNIAHLLEFGHRMVVGGTVARISGRKAGSIPKAKDPKRTGKGTVIGFVQPAPWFAVAAQAGLLQSLEKVNIELCRRIEEEVRALARL